MTIRAAVPTDLDRIAQLHAEQIDEGFLTSLGLPFLRRLYGRVLRSEDCFIVVDVDGAEVTGFVAGVSDLGSLYRRFVIRDGLFAAFRSAPRLLRSLPRVVETLRYPQAVAALPSAEILAVAVAARHCGAGIGRSLVRSAVAEFQSRSISTAKVVTTTDNDRALAVYRGAGFVSTACVEMHAGRSSEVLVWTQS